MLLDGTIKIESQAGAGTRIEVAIPVPTTTPIEAPAQPASVP